MKHRDRYGPSRWRLDAEALPITSPIIVLLASLLLSCAPAPAPDGGAPARTPDRDRRELIEAHLALIAAYESADVEGFVALLDASPDLLVFHPALENRFDGIEDIRENLGRMFSRLRSSSWLEFHPNAIVNGDVGWITAHVLIESQGLPAPFVGRGTEIWVRREAGWRLVHGHWSANPETLPAGG